MRILPILAALSLLSISGVGLATSGKPPAPKARAAKSVVATDVRNNARKLAQAWVDTAAAETLDALSNRSIAFAGMVPDLYVTLDGKRFNASRALVDSALGILKNNTTEADAAAIRNTVYILMQIANGQASRSKG